MERENRIEKPPVLYHGSGNRNIKVFEPRENTRQKDGEKKEFVFATDSFVKALPYMFKNESRDFSYSSGQRNGVITAVFPLSEQDLRIRDEGGAVYELSGDEFEEGDGYEWASEKPTNPLNKIEFDSTVDAMIENGVKVYCLSQKDYEDYLSLNSGEDRFSFLQNFKPLE